MIDNGADEDVLGDALQAVGVNGEDSRVEAAFVGVDGRLVASEGGLGAEVEGSEVAERRDVSR